MLRSMFFINGFWGNTTMFGYSFAVYLTVDAI